MSVSIPWPPVAPSTNVKYVVSFVELLAATVTLVAVVAVVAIGATSSPVVVTTAPAPPHTPESISSVTNWFEEFNTTTELSVPAANVAVSASAVIVPLALISPDAVIWPLVPTTLTLPLNSITSPSSLPIVKKVLFEEMNCNPPSENLLKIVQSGVWLFFNSITALAFPVDSSVR